MPSENKSGRSVGTPRRKGSSKEQNELDLPDFWDAVTYGKPFLLYFRTLFLDAVARRAPQVLRSLREDVWKPTRHHAETPDPTQTSRGELMIRWNRQRLLTEFHLPRWVLHHAGVTVNLWSADENWLKYPGWPSVPRGWAWSNQLPEDKSVLLLPPFRWEICGEPWSGFEETAMAEFRAALSSYREQMTSLALRYGFQKTPRKRSRAGRHSLVAFDYLALYQVRQWSAEHIANELDTDPEEFTLRAEAVMEQIHWAADAIDLRLRPPSKPGRPRKESS